MDTHRTRTLLLVGVLIGIVTFGASAAVLDAENTSTVSDGVTLGAPDGMNATIEGTTDVNLMEFDEYGSDTVYFFTTAGNVSFSAPGSAEAAIDKDNITGTFTNVTSIQAGVNDVTINPEDKQSITVGDQIDTVAWRDNPALDDGTVDFSYSGNTGTSKVVIGNLPTNTEIFAVDASSGTLLDRATSDGSGEATFSSLDNSQHSVTLQAGISTSPPVLDSLTPSSGQTSVPTQISVDLNDSDFGTIGDTVTVDITLDGTTLSTQTVSSNQTLTSSIPQSGQTGGAHSIEINATDSYSNTELAATTYSVPNTFFVRNETNHTELVPADGEIRFFSDDQVYTRNTSDGKFNMTGLPVTDFIVEVEPTADNYTERTVYVDSIFETQSAYVLNTSVYSTVENRFRLDDPTGNYDSETILKIQRPINVSGNTVYQTIVADKFGVEGVTATLEEGVRYKLLVSSETDSQTVGPFRADVSETVDVEPGTPTIELQDTQYGYAYAANLDNDTLRYRYADPTQNTDLLTVYIYERGNQSNQLTANTTYSDLGNASGVVSLSANQTDKEWVVAYDIERGSEEYVITEPLSNQKSLGPPIDSNWTLMIGIGVLFVFAGTFSVLNAGVGAVLVSLIGGLLWWLGFLGPATSGIAIAGALMISVFGHMLSSSR